MPKEKLLEKFIAPLLIIAIFLFLISFSGSSPKPPKASGAEFQISFLNVGQGDATYLNTQNIDIIIDGGPDKSILNSLAEAKPNLEKKLEYIFLTHPHADHLSGLNYLFDRYQLGKIFYTGTSYDSPDYHFFLNRVAAYDIPLEEAKAGNKYKVNDLEISILWPREGQVTKDVNNTSLVILANYKGKKFLLLGDLSDKLQDVIVADYELPDVDVLKVAHHGSKYGLSQALLAETKPEYAVISVGKNSYGHPAPTTITKLSGLKILRTDLLGNITFFTDGKELFLQN